MAHNIAAPQQKLWPESLDPSTPSVAKHFLKIEINAWHDMAALSASKKRGAVNGLGSAKNELQSTMTGQVEEPAGTCAIRMMTLDQNGSVLDAGSMRQRCVRESIDRTNLIEEQERCTTRLNLVFVETMNLLQCRKPAHASLVAASELRFSKRETLPAITARCWSRSRVIGNLGTW